MLWRFLKASGLLIVYMGLLAIPLLMWIQSDHPPSDNDILLTMLVVMVTFPLVMEIIGRWSFRFKGEGAPVPLVDLRSSILAINHGDLPVVVTEKNGKLYVTWKYLDAKWWEIMSKNGITQSYTLIVRFDERHHRVTLIDVMKNISWGKGPESVHFGFGFFRGMNFQVEIGKAWGINEQFRPGKLYDYRFSTSEIRNPIMNTILQSGWDVQLGMF